MNINYQDASNGSGWNSVENIFSVFKYTHWYCEYYCGQNQKTWKVITTTQPLILLMQNPQVKEIKETWVNDWLLTGYLLATPVLAQLGKIFLFSM